ncbi:Positive regulator of CheA protein activity [Minicystis rosea]|nr:Positive regulator of CheA protein activity [Minicystis rosea]
MADLVRRVKAPTSMKRSRQQDRGPRTEYLGFVLAGDVYAAPVGLVREILKPPPLTPVPRAPHATLGIVSVRGQLVTVIDLRRRLRVAEAPLSRKARILLVDGADNELMGVYVDEVLQVYRLSDGEIEPAATALGGEVAGYIAGIARPDGAFAPTRAPDGSHFPDASVVILLDLRAVLAS